MSETQILIPYDIILEIMEAYGSTQPCDPVASMRTAAKVIRELTKDNKELKDRLRDLEGRIVAHRSPMQKLVDICFQVALMVQDKQLNFHKMDREELAEWVAKQLRGCGFDTQPMGMSWGVLKNAACSG